MYGLLENLTAAQRAAVCHRDGPLLILAGPGSGKTRVITHRIAFLLSESVRPSEILALTFTNKAAEEMRLRLGHLAPGQPVWVGTFHRFCARILRQHAPLVGLEANFSIYDASDSLRVVKDAIHDASLELTHASPLEIADEISRAKNELVAADQYVARPGNPLGALVQQVYPAYQRRLLTANAVDFDDLLLHVVSLLQENPELRRILDERYRYIQVDEYQDTNFAQYAIVRALSQDYPNLAVTGDPDQSIYGWRGARLENILKFEHDFENVCVVVLEQNYRSTGRILRAADHLIAHNIRRKLKTLYTTKAEGPPVRLVEYPTSRDEAEQIAARIARDIESGTRSPGDFAVFFRVNSLSRPVETALRTGGVPYQVVRGQEFYERQEVKDLLAYLRLINNPRNDMALARIINTPPRKIGKSTVRRLSERAARRGCCLLEAAREAGLIAELPKRAAVHVAEFVASFDRLSLQAAAPLVDLLQLVLDETGYGRWLSESEKEADRERVANIDELQSAVWEFADQHPAENQLEAFLEQAALVNDTDSWEDDRGRVSLMTLHAAKGLEFPVVYIIAVEQGLLPHERNHESKADVEEERRLLFVGITRCREELQLSYAVRRLIRGTERLGAASEFLTELPRNEMEVIQPLPAQPPATERPGAAEWEYVPDDSDEPIERTPSRRPKKTKPLVVRVMTAAEMANGGNGGTSTLSPDDYCQGMLVNHPEHGLGKIVAVSGSGKGRTASVQFFHSAQPRTFVLVHSMLQPVTSRDL